MWVLELLRPPSFEPLWSNPIPMPELVNGIKFSAEGALLLVKTFDGKVGIIDSASGKEIRYVSPASISRTWVREVDFSPDSLKLKVEYSVSDEKYATDIWDVSSLQKLFSVEGRFVVFSPDSSLLAGVTEDGKPRSWNVRTGREIATYTEQVGHCQTVRFSPDNKLLVTNADSSYLESNDYMVALWEVSTGKLLKDYRSTLGRTDGQCFVSRNGLFAMSQDIRPGMGMLIWDLKSGLIVQRLQTPVLLL